MKRAELRNVREVRHWGLSNVEVREEGDGVVRFAGYATVFGREYEVVDSFGAYVERVAPGAFDRTLAEGPDVVLVINHEGLPLARTKSGTLRLMVDEIGLRVESELAADDPDVQALVPKFRRGDLDEMSFAFRVNGQAWNDDYTDRTITQVNLHRGDVSIVTFGANPATMAALRAALADEQVRAQLIAEDPEAARVLTRADFEESAEDETPAVDADDELLEHDDQDDDELDGAFARAQLLARLVATKVPPAA